MTPPHDGGLQIVPNASDDTKWLMLRLEGELDFATAAPLRARLQELDDQPLMLDLSGLTFTDSTGLAILLQERARALRQGTPFGICGVAGQTRELLERTGVLELFGSPTGTV